MELKKLLHCALGTCALCKLTGVCLVSLVVLLSDLCTAKCTRLNISTFISIK